MTTTREVKKIIEKQIETLSPAELAEYFIREMRQIAEREIIGEDVVREKEQLNAEYSKYIFNQDVLVYAEFWRAMYNQQFNEMEEIARVIDNQKKLRISYERTFFSGLRSKDCKACVTKTPQLTDEQLKALGDLIALYESHTSSRDINSSLWRSPLD